MNVLDTIRSLKKSGVSDRTVFTLTPLGNNRAERFDAHGIQYRVLASLKENGASTVNEIATDCSLSVERVKQILRSLHPQFVRKAD